MWFQFHIGSIKSDDEVLSMNLNISFQFHIGSIKRTNIFSFTDQNSLFQFHIGSIKSSHTLKCFVSLDRSFNSTLVQLKVSYDILKKDLLLRFNSTLVQLKGGAGDGEGLVEPKFQFHIGSIKSFIRDFDALAKTFVSIPHWFN